MKSIRFFIGFILMLAAFTVAVNIQTGAMAATMIGFCSDRDGDHEIYFMETDGSNVQQLTFNSSEDSQIAFSPDGARIMFVSDRDGNHEIYVMNIDGSALERLTNHPAEDLGPSWSPDGSKIAFLSERDGDREIFVMNSDGSGLQQLTYNTATDGFQDWSPDGSKIIFHSDRSGYVDIWIMNADGSNPQNLTNDAFRDFMPEWSPDGSKIVYESERGGVLELYLMDSDGSNEQRLTYMYTDNHEPDWSPDGSQIMFSSNYSGSYEVMVINTDGSGLQNLTNHSATDWSPSWRSFVPPYFGQDPPGIVPERFGPDSILATDSLFWHGSPIFSPDLQEMYWTYYVIHPGDHGIELFFMEVDDGSWTSPRHPTFADTNYGENNPFFSPGGDTLYFISGRTGGFIFMVTRTPSGWSSPVPLNIPLPADAGTGWQFSVANSGNIYFEIWRDNGAEPPDIFVTRFVNDQYQFPVSLGSVINSDYNEIMPYIDPNERYLIFSSNRPGGFGFHDIYISFKIDETTWTEPVNMGHQINSGTEDGWPVISPDGLYLFFTTAKAGDAGYNPYWVSCEVIDSIQAVPTQLKNYSASCTESGIEVIWLLNDIGQNSEFHVLRSRAGSQSYRELENSTIQREALSFRYVDEDYQPGSSYRYRVDVADELGRRILFKTDEIFVPSFLLTLNQNYPNPFNPQTKISFSLPEKAWVTLSIYSLRGDLIHTLVNGPLDDGFKEYIWNGKDTRGNPVSSGIYFYRLKAGKRTLTKKMLLLK